MSMIQVENLIKQYDKAKTPAVKGVSFNVNEGEFFAFLGPNGAGKTTTISILTTTLAKTSGLVTIAGYDIEKEAKKVRDKVGIIFQKPSLDLQLSAEENIRFHACLYGMYSYRPVFVLCLRSIKIVLWNLLRLLEFGIPSLSRQKDVGRHATQTRDYPQPHAYPAVLFLDEPTQGLDAVSRRSLWEYINNVRKEYGTTVFLTTHYIDEAEHVDQVCIINKGQIASCCSPEEMKRSLLRKEVILDAEDQMSLTSELSELGLFHKKDTPIIVPCQNRTPQEIISQLKTKLTVLEIKEPSLEDAYVDYISKTEGAA